MQLSWQRVCLALVNLWAYCLGFYTLYVVAQIEGRQEDQKFVFNLNYIAGGVGGKLGIQKDSDLNKAIHSPSKDPLQVVQQKPEASKQTNDSMQWSFARKAVWAKGCTVGYILSQFSFHGSILLLVIWFARVEGRQIWTDREINGIGVHG